MKVAVHQTIRFIPPSLFAAVTIFLMSAGAGYAQSTSFIKTPAAGVHLAFFDFKGADTLHAFGRAMKPGIALHFQNTLSARFDYCISLAGAFLDYNDKKNNSLGRGNKQLFVETDVSVRAKLLKKPAVFNPYVQAGAGVMKYDDYYGAFIPAGLGCQVNITPDVFVLINAQYRLPLTNTEHQHFYHSIGLAGAITRKKVVKIKQVPLPVQPVTVTKPVAKPVDEDGDGIPDSVDACPHVLGVVAYHGCPPPDKDGDGVLDENDRCPEVAGTVANHGCPEEKAPVVMQLNNLARRIFFETASYKILPQSYPALDSVITILKNDPPVHLLIEGHTDNKGTMAGNQVLSEKRAQTVMDYLIKGGIDARRLQAKGFGQQQPIESNNIPEGRAKNRRVVLTLIQIPSGRL